MNSNQDTLGKIITAHKKAEDYRRDHTTNRYPEEFKQIVRSAFDSGVSAHKIHQATGVNLNTLRSWRASLSEAKDILCFEPVRAKGREAAEQQGRIVLPSGVEILLPMSWIENNLMSWLNQDAA